MNIKSINKIAPANFSILDFNQGASNLERLFAVFAAIKQYKSNPTKEWSDFIYNRISIILSGGGPAFDNGHHWGYPILCACITIIREDDDLWGLFSDMQQKQLHEYMRMFALMWNFGCNADNDYRTGMGLHGNYRKKNVGVNYLLTNNALIVFLERYFGSIEKLNEVFASVDYEQEMSTLKELGLNRAHEIWTTEGPVDVDGTQYPGAKELFHSVEKREAKIVRQIGSDKIITYAGEGYGCKLPFAYKAQAKDERLYTALDIFSNILTKHCFCRICKSVVEIPFEDDFSAHIEDGTTSPYEGRNGMIREFDTGTDARKRSSIFHCEIDFMMLMCYFETMRLLGICEPTELPYWELVNVGMEDFIYKKEHGYVGYAMYHIEDPKRWTLRSELAIQIWKEDYRTDRMEG